MDIYVNIFNILKFTPVKTHIRRDLFSKNVGRQNFLLRERNGIDYIFHRMYRAVTRLHTSLPLLVANGLMLRGDKSDYDNKIFLNFANNMAI